MIDSKNEEDISENGFGEQHYQTMLESNDEKVISEMVTKFFNQTCDKDKCYVEQLNLLDCFSCLKGFKDSDDTAMPSSFKEKLVVAVVDLMKAMNTSDYSKITLQQMENFYINKMKRRVANKSQQRRKSTETTATSTTEHQSKVQHKERSSSYFAILQNANILYDAIKNSPVKPKINNPATLKSKHD